MFQWKVYEYIGSKIELIGLVYVFMSKLRIIAFYFLTSRYTLSSERWRIFFFIPAQFDLLF